MKNKQDARLAHLHMIEYLAMNLVQKLHAMEPPVEDFMAEASAFGVEYHGPNLREELYELSEVLKGTE